MKQIIKRMAITMMALLVSWCVYAQPNITRVEYYIDGDPGYGKATALSITAGTNLADLAININPANISEGVHILGVRAQDANGAWSHDNRWLFAKPYASDGTGPGPLPNITRVEYYLDSDPGYGSATALSISPGTDLPNLTINLDTSALTPGVHILGVRSKDANGTWSLDNRWLFAKPYASGTGPGPLPNITKVEYYLDNDPGYGNATALSISAGTDLPNLTINLDTSALTPGVHILGVRSKDANGAWSLDNRWLFARPYNDTIPYGPVTNLKQIEYYIDTDPGYGKGVQVAQENVSNIANMGISINISGLSQANHTLYMRSKDANNAWSLDNKWDFTVGTAITSAAIMVNSVSKKVLCAGAGFSIGYDAKGTYNAGNTFTVQLSDAAGSFTTPTTVGSVTGTALNGIITCTLPVSSTTGTGYKLRVVSSNTVVTGKTSTDALNITALPPTPTITPGGPTTFCQGDSVTLTSSSATADSWSTGATTQSILVKTGGNYTVTVTNASGCSNTSAITTVTVNALPTATITAGGATAICQGDSVIFTASSGTAYLWSTGATTQSITVKTGGNYTVKVTNASGCSNTSAATTVTVNALPTATITAGGATTFCQGDSVILTASSGTAYLWSTGATTQSITVKISGSYTVKVTNASGCSNTSAATTVTVNALPAATITAGGPTTFCQGDSVTLTSSSGTAYLWSTGAKTRSITVKTAGNYNVKVTNASGCSKKSTNAIVTVNALPSATITPGGPTTFCQGGSVTLTASAGSSYLWNTGEITQSISVNAGGNYTVKVTNASGCSNTSAATTVTVNALPTATITAGGPTTFCQGGSVTLTASAGSSYLWSTGATTQSINVGTAGNYTVSVTNASGCSNTSAATTVTVNANPAPTTTPSGNVSINQGSTVTINVNGTYSSYLWSTGATTPGITTGTAGSYSVTVTNAGGCSGTSAPVTVTVVNNCTKPTITAGGSTSNICPGKTVKLTSSAATSYLWSTGDTIRSITAKIAGSYTVTTGSGCTSDATIVTYTGCADPTGLAAGSITSTSAVLSWTAMPCATKYTVQYRQVGTTAWTTVTVTTPSLALTGLIAGTQYQWTIVAVCTSTSKSAKITGPKFTTASALQSVEIAAAQTSVLSAKLFPNPATDHALLQVSGAKGKIAVIITDMDGKTLWRSDNVIGQVELPVANFSNGTYLVNIIADNEIKKLKLVKAN